MRSYLIDSVGKSLVIKLIDDKNRSKKANFDFVIENYKEYNK